MVTEQLSADGRLRHLLTLEGLPRSVMQRIFSRADAFAMGDRPRLLSGQLIVNIFFESSTRTRIAFEASAKQLGADVVNLDQIRMAGDVKKESLADTVRTVGAMGASALVLRHGTDGAAMLAAAAAPPSIAVVNGGDGCNAHPTQGLTDAYTLRQRLGDDFSGLSVAIVGDVLHSRVARTNIHMLRILGAEDIRLVGPEVLCPPTLATTLGHPVINDMDAGIDGVDVVMLLRIQQERLQQPSANTVIDGGQRYFTDYGLDEVRLSRLKKEAMVMHPGPINRGVEIADAVADGPNSLILQQVTNGMVIRMAVLSDLLGAAG